MLESMLLLVNTILTVCLSYLNPHLYAAEFQLSFSPCDIFPIKMLDASQAFYNTLVTCGMCFVTVQLLMCICCKQVSGCECNIMGQLS